MKLAFTIHDAGMAMNIGGSVESITYLMDVPDEIVPSRVKWFLGLKSKNYMGLSLSIAEDKTPMKPAADTHTMSSLCAENARLKEMCNALTREVDLLQETGT